MNKTIFFLSFLLCFQNCKGVKHQNYNGKLCNEVFELEAYQKSPFNVLDIYIKDSKKDSKYLFTYDEESEYFKDTCEGEIIIFTIYSQPQLDTSGYYKISQKVFFDTKESKIKCVKKY